MDLRIHGDERPLQVTEIVKLTVTRAVNGHDVLDALVYLRDTRETVLPSIGRRVELICGQNGAPVFQGDAALISQDGPAWRIVALGDTGPHDLSRRTRSFSSPEGGRIPIPRLPGFMSSFREIADGLENLKAEVVALTQLWETDWEFLGRIASLCGCHLVVGNGRARVADRSPDATANASDFGLLDGSEEVESRLEAPDCKLPAWDWSKGEIHPDVRISASADRGVNDQAAGKGTELAGFVPQEPPDLGDAGGRKSKDVGAARAQSALARVFKWRGSFTDPALRPGQAISVPWSKRQLRLLVLRSVLEYEPRRAHRFINRVEAIPADLPPPGTCSPAAERGVVVTYGRVLASGDRGGLGLVRTSLPWSGPDGTGGVWCLAPQPFAGPHGGVVNLPAPDDWVVVLLQPGSLLPPVVLGSVWNGKARASSICESPESQRVLASTPGCSIVIKGNTLVIQGDVVIKGKLSIE